MEKAGGGGICRATPPSWVATGEPETPSCGRISISPAITRAISDDENAHGDAAMARAAVIRSLVMAGVL